MIKRVFAACRNPGRASLRLLPGLAAAALLVLAACAGVEEPVAEAPEPASPAPPERSPLTPDWTGTTWVVPDPGVTDPEEHADYRGFHLARDGRLLLVNLEGADGDTWTAAGNRLSLNLLDGSAGIPAEGDFLAFSADPDSDSAAEEGSTGGMPERILLVPEDDPGAEGMIFTRAGVDKDLEFNHWVPMTLLGGEEVRWPVNREIHLMLLSDGKGGLGILGYGGENRFHGPVTVGDEDFVVGDIARTRRIGPASDFENLYIGLIDAADRYVQVRDDLYLYEDTRFLASFRARIFD